MKKLLFTNLVYGKTYGEIFLNCHLKSFLDESNLPKHRDQVEYLIFTDEETHKALDNHPVIAKLSAVCPTRFVTFKWPDNSMDRFGKRYSMLIHMFRESVKIALEEDKLLSPMVADLVIAKDYVGKLFSRFEAGHDSVFVLPMRTAYEAMLPHILQAPGAMKAEDLFNVGYQCLHPLWVHCHWDSPQFTRLPFSLIWNTGKGMLVRSFSITPIAFQPKKEMLEAKQVIDVEVPSMCENPYWANDWVECPVMGVEPLACYYPPFKNESADLEKLRVWVAKTLHPSQKEWLKVPLYYPSKEVAMNVKFMGHDITYQEESNLTVFNILEGGTPREPGNVVKAEV